MCVYGKQIETVSEDHEMTSSIHQQNLRTAGRLTGIGTSVQRSIRYIGGVVVAWLQQRTMVSQEAGLHESRFVRAQVYDAQVIRRAVDTNSPNEVDWLLYASIITDQAKRRYCLEHALLINPDSAVAVCALAKLSGLPADQLGASEQDAGRA
jgi:hypothetical protein